MGHHPGMSAPANILPLLQKATYRSVGLGTNLTLRHELQGDCLKLLVSGSASDTLPESFTDSVTALFTTVRPAQAAVDLTTCSTLPSVILAFLVFWQKTAEECGCPKVVLYGVNPRILTMIKMIGMFDFFAVVADDAAMRAWYAKGQT
jgi:ABC-type transporter Mla MlaB component